MSQRKYLRLPFLRDFDVSGAFPYGTERFAFMSCPVLSTTLRVCETAPYWCVMLMESWIGSSQSLSFLKKFL